MRKVEPVSSIDYMELMLRNDSEQDTSAANHHKNSGASSFEQMFQTELDRLNKKDLRQGAT